MILKMIRSFHVFSNVRDFLKNNPFYPFYFKTEGIDVEIADRLQPRDVYPAITVPSPSNSCYLDEDIFRYASAYKPDLIHCHHWKCLKASAETAKSLNKPLFFSIYRNQIKNAENEIDEVHSFFGQLKGMILPNVNIKEQIFSQYSPSCPLYVLGEVLDASYFFKKTEITEEKRVLTFAVMISVLNIDYIHNVHSGLEKILMTNNELKISWVCFGDKLKREILKDVKSRSLERYVSITDLQDFPLLAYEGLITDGQGNYSEEQYLHLLLSCIKEEKLLIVKPEEGLEDILLNGVTCLAVPDYSSGKLAHLIHFFITFPEEIVSITKTALEFYREQHSFEVNSRKLSDLYQNAVR